MTMADSTLTYRIAFASLRGINATMATELMARFGSEEVFFKATERQLSSAMGFKNRLMEREYRNNILEQARREEEFVRTNNINTLYYTDTRYPQRLSHCDDAPLMLYSLGNINYNSGFTVSVVGTRHATPYGIEFTDRLIKKLSETVDGNLTVISGLAYGVDVAAHKSALRHGIPTVGVLAHGLNTIYPAVHRNIAADMIRKDGGLITDYRSCDPVHKSNFLARNRIVAGLCDCLVVVESALKGGAMVTAKIAAGYNRDVFALPGRNTDFYSQGCNKLITLCVAGLIQDADDLIDAMRWPVLDNKNTEQPSLFAELSPEEKAAAHYIAEQGEAQLNRMSIDLNIPVGRLMSTLIELEFKGIITAYPGGNYRPCRTS